MGNRATGVSRRGRPSGNATVETRRFKVLIVGASGVGKTTLFRRLLDQPPPLEYEPSTAVEIGAKLIQLEGRNPALVELWDVPHRVYTGKDMFETYLKSVDGVLLVYDAASPASWQAVLDYHKLLKEKTTDLAQVVMSVVGNKIDTVSEPNEEAEAVLTAREWVTAYGSAQAIQHHLVSVDRQLPVFDILRSCVNNMQKVRSIGHSHLHSSSPVV